MGEKKCAARNNKTWTWKKRKGVAGAQNRKEVSPKKKKRTQKLDRGGPHTKTRGANGKRGGEKNHTTSKGKTSSDETGCR